MGTSTDYRDHTRTINLRVRVLIGFVLSAAIARVLAPPLLGHPSNFTPIGAMALFAGAHFTERWKALLLPFLTLFISDVIIQQFFYHGQYGVLLYEGWYWTYAAFALIVLLGRWMIRKVSAKSVLLAVVSASLAHWLITDFGTWLGGGLDISTGKPYTADWEGLTKCYYLALPFLKDFALGAISYSAVMFGSFEWVQKRFPILQPTQSTIGNL